MEIWTGTADVTNGDATITVDAGDPLSDANCSPGSLVLIDGVAYFVLSRTSTLAFELTRPYAGSTDTAVSMEISPVNEATTNLVNLATIVARVQSQLNIFDKNSQGLFFTQLGVTGAADPGPGRIAFDDADPAAVTEIYLDVVDANGRAVDGLIDLWTAGTTVLVRSLGSTAYVAFQLPAGVEAQSGWRSATVEYLGHDGVIADDEELSISWFRVGEGLQIDFVGSFSYRSTFNTEAPGFMYLSTNGNGSTDLTPSLYRKNTAASDGWSTQVPFQGPQGDKGWAPRFAIATDGERRVLQLAGYVGGEGDAPTVGVGQYVAVGGLDPDIADGVDIRGATGAPGSDGVNGTDPGILLNWDDGTTDADPGAGNIRADNASLALAAELFISEASRGGSDIEAYLLTLDDSTNTIKGTLIITDVASEAQATFNVTGITDATDYVKVSVSDHSGATSFADGLAVSFQFLRAGDQGSSDLASVVGAVNGADAKDILVGADILLITDSEDGATGKKVTAAGAGRYFGTRAIDVCTAVAGSKGVASRLFLPGATADGFCSNDGIDDTASANYVLDAGVGRVSPTTAVVEQVDQAAGAVIGDLTGNGGLAAAFDGVTSQSYTACARTVNTTDLNGYAGKDFSGSPRVIDHAVFWGSNDVGLNGPNGGASTVTVKLRAKNGSPPANRADGDLLATYGPVTDPNGHTATLESSDKETAWDYVWLDCETSTSGIYLAEAQFFEVVPVQDMTLVTNIMSTDVSAEAVVVTLIVRPIDSVDLNTDLTVEVSRDDGVTFALGTLVQLHGVGADRYCETEAIAVDEQDAGSGLIVRIMTENSKNLEIRGLYVEAR